MNKKVGYMNNLNVVMTTVIAIALVGCTTPYKPPLIEPSTASFSGIHPSSTDVKETNLVMIHGMCHHDKRWVENTRQRLANYFRMDETIVEPLYEDITSDVSVYKTRIYDDTNSINLYGIVYGPSTLPIKREFLCKDVSKESEVCQNITYKRERASLNAALKNGLLNDCLADAVIYLSDKGEIIRKGVKRSLLKIMESIESSDGSLFFLSESLGSKVLRDALLCDSDEKIFAGISFISKSKVIYLGANQIPILNLGNNNECDLSRVYMDAIEKSGAEISGGFEDVIIIINQNKYNKELSFNISTKTPTVISFTDPNDLLSYEIGDEYSESIIINVIVSNTETWFGFLENPVTAHMGYRNNDDVIDLIKCGKNNPNYIKCMSE